VPAASLLLLLPLHGVVRILPYCVRISPRILTTDERRRPQADAVSDPLSVGDSLSDPSLHILHLQSAVRPHTSQVNSALHPSGVAQSSTSFGWGKGGNVTSAGWQVTLCDPKWHVSFRSGVATLRTAMLLLLTYLLTYYSPHGPSRL